MRVVAGQSGGCKSQLVTVLFSVPTTRIFAQEHYEYVFWEHL